MLYDFLLNKYGENEPIILSIMAFILYPRRPFLNQDPSFPEIV